MKTNQKIPEGWSVKKLGDVCTNKGQYGANAAAVSYSQDLPLYIRITDIDDDGKYLVSNRASVNISDYKHYLLKKGDIVFARTGATTGKTYLYNEKDGELVFAGFLIKFSPDISLIEPYYLKLLTDIPIYKHWVTIMSVRSGQPGINAEEYAKYPLLLPPLPEQEKIAEILGTWDTAIEKLSALIEQKKATEKGLMQRLLTAKIRLPGFTDEWQKVKLGSICIFETAKSKSSSINENGKYYIVDMGAVSIDGSLIPTKTTDLKEDLLNINDVIMPKDDIGGGNIIGKTTIIKKENAYVLSDHVFKLKIHDADALFVSYLINSFQCNKYMRRMSNGSAVLGLAKKDVEKCSLCLPTDVSEQKAIADILSKADEEITLLTEKLSALKTQKTGLMQKLLTGQIRVKVA